MDLHVHQGGNLELWRLKMYQHELVSVMFLDPSTSAAQVIIPSFGIGFIVSWLLAVAHSHNLFVYYPQPEWSLTLYEATPFHVYTLSITALSV